MPIYDYQCPRCGRRKEVITKGGGVGYRCECGQEMEKQIARANFELKGKGWYKDGYQ